MANRRVLVDTSVIIDFLRKSKKEDAWLWQLQETSRCYMSVITLFELLSGAKTEQHIQDIAKLRKMRMDYLVADGFSETAAMIFRELKNMNQVIEYRDIFIAATAKIHHCQVATLNVEHFARIQGVELLKRDLIQGRETS